MKYDPEEQLREVLRRRNRILKKRNRQRTQCLGIVSVLLFAALSVCIPHYARTGSVETGSSAFGSFLLFPEAGSYLLVALIALVAGIVITALTIRYRNSRDRPKDGSESSNNAADDKADGNKTRNEKINEED